MSEREQLEKEIAAEVGFRVIVESCQISGDADKTLPLTIVRRGNYFGIASESELSLWNALVSARLRLREVEQERDRESKCIECGAETQCVRCFAVADCGHYAFRLRPDSPDGSYCVGCNQDIPPDNPLVAQAGKLAAAARHLIETEAALRGTEFPALRTALIDWEKEA